LRHLLNPIHFAARSRTGTATLAKGQQPSPSNDDDDLAMQFPPLPKLPTSTTAKTDGTSASNNDSHEKPVVSAFPSRDKCRVLILGCGNSTLGEEMQRDGWLGPIANVDFSQVVIDQMKNKYDDAFYDRWYSSHKRGPYSSTLPPPPPKMEFVCADITGRLPFDDQSFDLIVCKGSFDAILTSAGSKCSILCVVQECARLLSNGHGIFFLVTHGNPDSRIEYLEHNNRLDHYWLGVSVHNVARPSTLGKLGGSQRYQNR